MQLPEWLLQIESQPGVGNIENENKKKWNKKKEKTIQRSTHYNCEKGVIRKRERERESARETRLGDHLHSKHF